MIAVPHLGEIKTKLATRLMEFDERDDVELYFSSAQPVDVNRNRIANHFIEETDHDYILMVDSDIIPPSNVLEVLDYDEKVISPVIFSNKDGVPYPVGMTVDENGRHTMDGRDIQGELREVDSVGTGCIFIHRDVFESLEKPYFSFTKNEEGELVKGEDMGFCDDVRDAGFDVKMAMEYFAGHLAEVDLSNMMRMLHIALTTRESEVFTQQVGDKTERDK